MATSTSPARAYVRLTAPAVADLQRLLVKDPQIVRSALKKMLLLERHPNAGEPLLGSLIGWRKLVVGKNHWRIVWRVTTDELGAVTITISEVWAIGARSDAEIYREMQERAASANDAGDNRALHEVVQLLGQQVSREEIAPSREPDDDPVPSWLRRRLIRTAGLRPDDVDRLSGEAAMIRWERYMSSGD